MLFISHKIQDDDIESFNLNSSNLDISMIKAVQDTAFDKITKKKSLDQFRSICKPWSGSVKKL